MLQYPTNVSLDNQTFDPSVSDSNNKLSFTFNGDFLTGVLYKVYNYNTGELVKVSGNIYPSPSMNQDHAILKYNGQLFETEDGFLSQLTVGNDYAIQMQLVQYNSTGTAPLYDMFVLRGLTQQNYISSDGYITIEDNISNIYEWDTNGTTVDDNVRRYPSTAWDALAGTMTLVIGDQKRDIQWYEPKTGKVGIANTLTEGLPAGTPYQIWANYKVTPLYFFKCRSTPSSTLTLAVEANYDEPMLHHVTGTYSQAQNSLINYYTIALYWTDTTGSGANWRKVDETPRIYSQQINYKFYDDFILRYEYRGAASTYALYYKAVITINTIDGMTIQQDSNIINAGGVTTTVATTTVSLIVQDNDRADTFYFPSHNDKHSVRISYSTSEPFPSGTRVMWYRENLRTGETEIIESGEDITVPTKGNFRYYIVPRIGASGSAYLKGIGFADIELNMKGYSISELKLMPEQYQYGTRPRYRIGDQWKIVGEVQDTTVSQNTDRYLHVGYNNYPTLTLTKTNYMSGTLSAMNGYVDCTTRHYEDNIDLIRAWRDFITRPTIYMLKSQKGDVWIVNVTDNPTTTYSEMEKDIPTTFSFNWAECCDVKDIKILDYSL